jgi:hypothetical protein
MASSVLTPCRPTCCCCCRCCCSRSPTACPAHWACAGLTAVALCCGFCAPGRVDAALGTAALAIAQEMAAAAAATPPNTGCALGVWTPRRLLLAPPLLPLLGGRGTRCTPGPEDCCRVLPAVLLPNGLPDPVMMSRPELVSGLLLMISGRMPLLLLLLASAATGPAADPLAPAIGLAPAAPASAAAGLSL